VAFSPASSLASGGGGNVFVTNFPADQLVHFTQPVTVDVDNFPASQAVTVESLPLPDGAATEETLATAAESLDDVGLTAILQRDKLATDD
jgi:hypothetical protein